MLLAVAVAFVPTQLPLGILEGVVSAGIYCFIVSRRPTLVQTLRVTKREAEAV
jgi:cobalt/nickel transport system permease protein